MKKLLIVMIILVGCSSTEVKKPNPLKELGCGLVKTTLGGYIADKAACSDVQCVQDEVQNGLALVKLCEPIATSALISGAMCVGAGEAVLDYFTAAKLAKCGCTGGEAKESIIAGLDKLCSNL